MKDFDDYIKKHLENINPPFDESAELAWERLLPRLPQQKKPTLLPLFLPKLSKSFFVAVSLGTLFLGSALLFLQNNNEQNNGNIAKNLENKTESQIIQEQKNNVDNNNLDNNKLNNKNFSNKNTQNNITQKSGIIANNNDNDVNNENTTYLSLDNANQANSKVNSQQNQQKQNLNKNTDDKKFTVSPLTPKGGTNPKEQENIKNDVNLKDNLLVKTGNFGNKTSENNTSENDNLFTKNVNLQPLKTVLPQENFESSKANNIFLNNGKEEKKQEKNTQNAEILTSRLAIDCSLPKQPNKILVKNGFYVHQSQMVAPLIEATNRNIGLGLANEVIFNDKYSIFTTLGISQQKYNYQSSEVISNNTFFLRGNSLNNFNTYITQNMLSFNIEGRIYPNFMFGKGFFGLGLPTQIIFQENRFDEGLEYWQLTQDKSKSNIFNGFTHLSFSMGASVALNSKTELQIAPVFQIPLYKLYKENIAGYTFGVKGVVLLR